MIEGSGSIPLTNGSGSSRPKNIRIRRIRLRIRNRNTAFYSNLDKLPMQKNFGFTTLQQRWTRCATWPLRVRAVGSSPRQCNAPTSALNRTRPPTPSRGASSSSASSSIPSPTGAPRCEPRPARSQGGSGKVNSSGIRTGSSGKLRRRRRMGRRKSRRRSRGVIRPQSRRRHLKNSCIFFCLFVQVTCPPLHEFFFSPVLPLSIQHTAAMLFFRNNVRPSRYRRQVPDIFWRGREGGGRGGE
jgi:hypothetical protein